MKEGKEGETTTTEGETTTTTSHVATTLQKQTGIFILCLLILTYNV